MLKRLKDNGKLTDHWCWWLWVASSLMGRPPKTDFSGCGLFFIDGPMVEVCGIDLCCKQWLDLIYVICFLFVCIVVDYG